MRARGLKSILLRHQARGKGKFPGPCPIVASGGPYTLEQAAEAKAAGAEAFYLPASEGFQTRLFFPCVISSPSPPPSSPWEKVDKHRCMHA